MKEYNTWTWISSDGAELMSEKVEIVVPVEKRLERIEERLASMEEAKRKPNE